MKSRLVMLLGVLIGCVEAPPSSPKNVAGGSAARGSRLIAQYGCGNCHTIPGVSGARGLVGPPLTAFSQRSFIAGSFRNEGETLVRWIMNPQEMRPGTAMPSLVESSQHARDIAAYLYTLHEGGLGPPHLIPQKTLPAH
jgi:cytochrome c